MNKFEYEPDDHTIFMGVVSEEMVDGTVEYSVERLSIIVYIDGIDHDVTEAIAPGMFELYKNDYLNKYKELYVGQNSN